MFKHSVALFGTAITGALAAFSKELVAAIAGLVRLGAIGSALSVALRDEFHPKAALITFVMTLSGGMNAAIGSAFWWTIAGALALLVQRAGQSHFALPPR